MNKFYEKIKQNMFFNEILIIIIEGYIEFLFAGILIFQVPENNQDNNIVLIGIGSLYLIVCIVVIPIIFIWILHQKLEFLKSEEFEKRWGALIENIRLNCKINVTNYLFFCMRRILFISAYLVFSKYVIFQILTINYLNLLFTMYQGHFRPISSYKKNIIEIRIMICSSMTRKTVLLVDGDDNVGLPLSLPLLLHHQKTPSGLLLLYSLGYVSGMAQVLNEVDDSNDTDDRINENLGCWVAGVCCCQIRK